MDKIGLKVGILLTKIAIVCCNFITRFLSEKDFLGEVAINSDSILIV